MRTLCPPILWLPPSSVLDSERWRQGCRLARLVQLESQPGVTRASVLNVELHPGQGFPPSWPIQVPPYLWYRKQVPSISEMPFGRELSTWSGDFGAPLSRRVCSSVFLWVSLV